MDYSQVTFGVVIVLILVLIAEAANGWTDAPCGTSSAVASGVLSGKTALLLAAGGNFIGLIIALMIGAKVAQTIGTGIVRPSVISISSIGIAMVTTILWASLAAWLGLPVSKTHSLLAALAGIGWAQGGFEALTPESGNLSDSGWIKVAQGFVVAIVLGSTLSWFLGSLIRTLNWNKTISESAWRRMQVMSVSMVATGHGFNDGLKYVGVFSLVLYKAGVTPAFQVSSTVVVLCAIVMALGTMLGGWRIHHRLDAMVNHTDDSSVRKKLFEPYMGVCAEFTAGFFIWQTGILGIPTSTTHTTVSAMAAARSSTAFGQPVKPKKAQVDLATCLIIFRGWIITYAFCGLVAFGIMRFTQIF